MEMRGQEGREGGNEWGPEWLETDATLRSSAHAHTLSHSLSRTHTLAILTQTASSTPLTLAVLWQVEVLQRRAGELGEAHAAVAGHAAAGNARGDNLREKAGRQRVTWASEYCCGVQGSSPPVHSSKPDPPLLISSNAHGNRSLALLASPLTSLAQSPASLLKASSMPIFLEEQGTWMATVSRT
jgi:hypothetical protein